MRNALILCIFILSLSTIFADADKAGPYQAYTASAVSSASNQRVILFFHAPWCPTCRGEDAAIKGGLSKIPADVTIFKVDYDSQDALKKKYSVRSQSTFVQIDKQGSLVKKWAGSDTIDAIVSEIAPAAPKK